MKKQWKQLSAFLLAIVLMVTLSACGTASDSEDQTAVVTTSQKAEQTTAQDTSETITQASAADSKSVADIIAKMTLDEKISQMIIPAIRTWNGSDSNLTNLEDAPELKEALTRHQYGGVILFGQNVESVSQTATLVSALQQNNAQMEASTRIPYLMPLDMEGGIVNRLSMGTRMTGNMAIGATGDKANSNAITTGTILGEEMAALGFNVDFAPDIDVNSNPANPVIGTRSFSDDAAVVSELGAAVSSGLAENNVIATYKHFPGHGDTNTDSHIGTPSVAKTLDELEQVEFIPFRSAIEAGADMIMTAHITYPNIDDTHTFADGTEGYYPATMSHKMIEEILRATLGYDGVVVTDALEMDAIATGGLVEGAPYSAEYAANIAEQVIGAGVDILLVPADLNGTAVDVVVGQDDEGNDITTTYNKIDWYDEYLSRLIEKVENGTISEDRINESVTRILNLKEKYGILRSDTSGKDLEAQIAKAETIVGSQEHHAKEMEIARQAITLLKNDDNVLPINGEQGGKYVFAGRTETETLAMSYAADYLIKEGLIPEDTCVVNLNSGETKGSADSSVSITIDYYSGVYAEKPELQAAVKEADAVIGISNSWGLADISDGADQYEGMQAMRRDVQDNGGVFIALSDNLPYDSARYQEANAILLAYMGSAMGTDPTERDDHTAAAYNANVLAAFATIFGGQNPTGTLPVVIPVIEDQEGTLAFSEQVLYERGYGLTYSQDETDF